MTKIKYGCEAAFATCLITEVVPNPQSSLVGTKCLDQEQVNDDVYVQLEAIQTNSDLTELIEQCLDYVLVGGKLFVKNALLKQGEEICALKEEIEIFFANMQGEICKTKSISSLLPFSFDSSFL